MVTISFDAITNTLPPDPSVRPAPSAMIDAFAKDVPDALVEFWIATGIGGFATGLFWMIDPREILKEARRYPSLCRAIPFGATAFGDFYSFSNGKVFNTSVDYNLTSEVSPSLELFGFGFFAIPENNKELLSTDFRDRVAKKLGPIEEGECYGYKQALALGGDECNVNNVEIVSRRIYLSVLNEIHGN